MAVDIKKNYFSVVVFSDRISHMLVAKLKTFLSDI